MAQCCRTGPSGLHRLAKQQPYAIIDFIPRSGIINLATAKLLYILVLLVFFNMMLNKSPHIGECNSKWVRRDSHFFEWQVEKGRRGECNSKWVQRASNFFEWQVEKGGRLCNMVRLAFSFCVSTQTLRHPSVLLPPRKNILFPNQVNAIFLSTEENIVVQHNGVLLCIICRVSKTLISINNKNVTSHVVY
jgi:hypothetical protein